jgi:hypothetical protein
VLRQIATKPVPPISSQNPAVPQGLESIVHKAISRDPDERYQTGGEFAADLERFLDGATVLAKPYRHIFNSREIEASRPRWLIFASLFCFLISLFAFMNCGLLALAIVIQQKVFWLRALTFLLFWLVTLVGSLFAGFGILAGRKWARTACIITSLLAMSTTAAGTWAAFQSLAGQPLALRAAPLVVAALVCITAGSIVWGLFTHRTSEWFAYAQRLRAEHRATRGRAR